MTWQSAKKAASRLLDEIRPLGGELARKHNAAQPKTLRLAAYPTLADFRFFRPDDKWSWLYHTEVCRALVRLAAREGLRIELFDCTAAGCAAWCEERGLVADTKNRAMYVSFLYKK